MDTVGSTNTASDLQMNYMTLLVAQLQNQNPLEPMDNQDMSAQLAQFSQLEQLESMNSSFGMVLDSVQRSYASSLIGKEVSFTATASDGTQEALTGVVEEVALGSSGDISLVVDGREVDLANVLSIRE
jgi:flagellar basal-body rod modification protein FlgD